MKTYRARSCIAAVVACVVGGGCGMLGGSSSPLGNACVVGVLRVAHGPNNSLYVQDSRGIVHYSNKGKMLARFGPKRDDFAVDSRGNVYYLRGSDIVKVSPLGAVLRGWHAPDMYPEAVDGRGDVIAAKGGVSFTGDGPDRFNLYSPSGSLIAHWTSSYSGQMVFDRAGNIYATGQIGDVLARLNPRTGAVEASKHSPVGVTYDQLGADPSGNIYVGATDGNDAPFAVARVLPKGNTFHFKVLNNSQETVSGLAVDADGTIFVIRNSYSESSSTNTGLEVLSNSGASKGRVPSCK